MTDTYQTPAAGIDLSTIYTLSDAITYNIGDFKKYKSVSVQIVWSGITNFAGLNTGLRQKNNSGGWDDFVPALDFELTAASGSHTFDIWAFSSGNIQFYKDAHTLDSADEILLHVTAKS